MKKITKISYKRKCRHFKIISKTLETLFKKETSKEKLAQYEEMREYNKNFFDPEDKKSLEIDSFLNHDEGKTFKKISELVEEHYGYKALEI
jgi:hypothetical protein